MPHVIVEGPVSLEEVYQKFTPFVERDEDTIMKVNDLFLNARKNKALLECVVVEDRVSMNFYMGLSQRDGGITVHLDPLTDPEKTDGVKRLIALVGHTIKLLHPDCRYGKTNLEKYLIE